MSFTTLAIVKKHLLSSDVGALKFEDAAVTLSGENEALLPHQNLTESSETVKWDTSVVPLCEGPLELTDDEKSTLSIGQIVRNSVVVTADETLSTVYAEQQDYVVDYSTGAIHRMPGGHIPDNQPVYIYYAAYTLFSATNDYIIDYVRGTLRRRSGSAIPDRAKVLVDYTVSAGSVTDELISQAILEAEDLIVRSLATDYNASSTDQGLKTGATMLVLSIAARDMAVEGLAQRSSTDSGGRAKEWQNLSALYETRAWQTLRPFLERYPIHAPERHLNA